MQLSLSVLLFILPINNSLLSGAQFLFHFSSKMQECPVFLHLPG